MKTYTLELTINKTDSTTDYDFITSEHNTRQEAIAQEEKCLSTRIEKAKSGNQIWKSYSNWQSFKVE